MLVYANYLELEGEDSYKDVFRSLCGWLKKKTGKKIKPIELIGSNKINYDSIRISTESACLEVPNLYAITIKHLDEIVSGRQWITEIGICYADNKTIVSVVLKTDEISSLVNSDVFTTRPLLIRYICQNSTLSKNSIGVEEKTLDGGIEAYKAFLYEIEKFDREYPIVLVSPNAAGEYVLDCTRLQEQLIGLAQVVKIPPEYNSYEMSEILGQQYSAWSGAINVIFTPYKNGRVRYKLIQSKHLEDNCKNDKERISFLLSTVTHNTNIPKIRRQIRSEGVKAKSLKDRFRSRLNNKEISGSEEIEEILELAATQEKQFKEDIERIEFEKMQLEERNDNLNGELQSANWNIGSLKKQLQGQGKSVDNVVIESLLATACRTDDPTPIECIEIIESALGDKIIFLDSAINSAKESTSFKRGRILLDMMRKLIVEYLPLYLEGGDNKTRCVFTNKQYAANESETVTNNAELFKTREFEYNGKSIYMSQHLKVGTADNPTHTIRVHFFIDKDSEKVVVGYCGEHLPLHGH